MRMQGACAAANMQLGSQQSPASASRTHIQPLCEGLEVYLMQQGPELQQRGHYGHGNGARMYTRCCL